MEVNRSTIESMIREILMEKLSGCDSADFSRNKLKEGVISVKVPTIRVTDKDLMNTGKAGDIVYTKDLFTLPESPR